MYIDVDKMTDDEVVALQQEQWSGEEFEGKKDRMSLTMKELCENMRGMCTSSYRNYLKQTNEAWKEIA